MYASFVLFLISIIAIPVVAVLRLATGQVWFEGQATAIIVILLVSSAQFFFFFVMGQYLGRIYDEVRGRPLYIVADTFGFPQQRHDTKSKELDSRHRLEMTPGKGDRAG
jgi:polyisoprenyl-phosphate glycosyltransferase